MNAWRRPVGLLALVLAGCAPGPGTKAVPRRVPPPARALSSEDRKQLDRRYYEAVDAYMKADYAAARAAIREILAADPAHAGAQALLARVRAAEKASAAP
jgi:Tfp pilus assembly protein PilF